MTVKEMISWLQTLAPEIKIITPTRLYSNERGFYEENLPFDPDRHTAYNKTENILFISGD